MLIDYLQSLDEKITLSINNCSSAMTDEFMRLMSDTQVWIPMYVIIALLLFRQVGWKKTVVIIISIILTFACCDQFSNLMKYSVGRLRPCYNYNMVSGGLNMLEWRGGLFGFFSAHAANAFGFVVSALIGLRAGNRRKKYRGAILCGIVWASLVSISRIFVGKHFLGDILVGSIIGITTGCVFGLASGYIMRKYIDRNLTVAKVKDCSGIKVN